MRFTMPQNSQERVKEVGARPMYIASSRRPPIARESVRLVSHGGTMSVKSLFLRWHGSGQARPGLVMQHPEMGDVKIPLDAEDRQAGAGIPVDTELKGSGELVIEPVTLMQKLAGRIGLDVGQTVTFVPNEPKS